MNALPVTKEETSVARPLNVLVDLIKEDLAKARDASEKAAAPFIEAASLKCAEARSQMTYSEYLSWAFRHFKWRETQARQHLSIGRYVENNSAAGAALKYESVNQFLREELGHNRPNKVHPQAWHEPVKKVVDSVNVDALRQADLKRAEERELQRKLALQLIDIGYKALAAKLHPDVKGGSREAMAHLNEVRARLKKWA